LHLVGYFIRMSYSTIRNMLQQQPPLAVNAYLFNILQLPYISAGGLIHPQTANAPCRSDKEPLNTFRPSGNHTYGSIWTSTNSEFFSQQTLRCFLQLTAIISISNLHSFLMERNMWILKREIFFMLFKLISGFGTLTSASTWALSRLQSWLVAKHLTVEGLDCKLLHVLKALKTMPGLSVAFLAYTPI
jgi:hypothetical protein